jgi:hypothetical protein
VNEVCTSSGVAEEVNNIEIFPNPSTGMIYANGGEIKLLTIQVIDLMGRIKFEQNHVVAQEFDLSNLQKGTYVLRMQTDNGVFISKTLMLH